ncbi:MAG TPA: hypothetical protein VMW54_12040 [Terriglobia bacterium]|nr:hypothetical protein [Terriglobia bacterium]
MRLPRLNLSALRARRLPRVRRAGLSAIELLDSQARLSFTRREMLGLAGTAAATLPLKLGGPQGRLQFVPGHKRLAFKLDGSERWAIDTRRFAGNPRLRTEQRDHLIRVALVNARYPGTNLPADMECELTRAAAGWRMQIKMALGGFQGTAPFEPWLRGETAPRSIVNLDESVEAFGKSSSLHVAGRAQAQFFPNWTLRLAGKGIAQLSGFGGQTVSDSLVIALLSPDEPSVVRKPAERRTLLAINRDGRSWPFEPLLGPKNSSDITVSDSGFRRIRIEAGEDAGGNASRALVAESQGEDAGIAFAPQGDFWASNGEPLRLPLRNARYAIAGNSTSHQAALVAGYGREPIWIHTNGCSFEVGDSEDAPAFEAVSLNGQPPRFSCTPSVKQIAAPLPGVAVEPGAVKQGTQLAFLSAPQPQETRTNSVTIPAQIFRHKITKKKKKKKAPRIKLNTKQLQKQLQMRLRQQKATEQQQSQPAPVKVLRQVEPQTREPAPQTGETVPQTHETAPRIPSRGVQVPHQLRPGSVRVILQAHPGKKKKVSLQEVLPSRPEPNFAFDFIRPDDLLALKFEFYNLTLSAGAGSPSLVRVQPNQLAYVVVQFWPQHVAEEAFLESSTPAPLHDKSAEPPITSRVAGPSRLAFLVPASITEIPYTVKSLLDWAKYEQSVTPLATPPKRQTFAIQAEAYGSSKPSAEPQVNAIQKSPQYYQQIEPYQSQTAPPANVSKKRKRGMAIEQNASALQQGTFAGGQLIQLAQIKEPGALQTSIEVPYRIILSPNYYAGWAHATNPVKRGDRVELWHTRLGVRAPQGAVDEKSDFYRTLRAVWATDYPGGCLTDITKDLSVFSKPAITTYQRYQIVRLSSDPTIVYKTDHGQAQYVPQPLQVNRLMLSTMGAWLNSEGTWNLYQDVVEPSCKTGHFTFGLENWRHIAAMGRDQYVRIVERGFLFPFGHKAVMITITERKFNRTPDGSTIGAYLRQQTFVVVREHEKNYPAVGQPNPKGPQLPFQTVRINTLSTPALSGRDPVLAPVVRFYRLSNRKTQENHPAEPGAFWPLVDNQDFQFKMEGVDWEGNTSEFTAPLIFVGANDARDPGQSEKVMAKYNTSVKFSRRVRPFYGQKVAYARHKVPGDTTFETDSMSFKGQIPAQGTSLPQGLPYFYPAISLSKVRIATVERLTGMNASTAIQYHPTYLLHGIESGGNKGQVFAQLLNTVPLLFGGSGGGADKVGGLLTPSMEITGLSRLLGPVAGTLDTIAAGKFDPAEFFKSALEAKLLGDISLAEVVKTVTDISGSVKKIPKFVTSHLPDKIVTSFEWQPEIQSVSTDKNNGIKPFFVVNGDATQALTVSATLTKTLDNKPPTYQVNATLKDFEIDFIPTASPLTTVLVLTFDELTFRSVNGQKPDVKVKLANVEFKGALTFVNELKKMIPSGGGFDDPPSLDITAQGIKVGYSLGLPPVSIGVFNLSNLSLAAQLSIYFTGEPITFEFDFCQEHHPFLLTVSLFGGGGYFGLWLTPKGIQKMSAEFEFGGNFALNIGVASGGVYVMAGFSYTHENHKTELTGYLRCGGALEVLAIVTISVEFKMGLKYISDGNKVWGRATLTVEIDILFFSKSVDLTVERQFAGDSSGHSALLFPGEPYPLGPMPVSFSDEMGVADWQIYCEAFA